MKDFNSKSHPPKKSNNSNATSGPSRPHFRNPRALVIILVVSKPFFVGVKALPCPFLGFGIFPNGECQLKNLNLKPSTVLAPSTFHVFQPSPASKSGPGPGADQARIFRNQPRNPKSGLSVLNHNRNWRGPGAEFGVGLAQIP